MKENIKIIATNPDDELRSLVEQIDKQGVNIDYIVINKPGDEKKIVVESKCSSTLIETEDYDTLMDAVELVKCPIVGGDLNDEGNESYTE